MMELIPQCHVQRLESSSFTSDSITKKKSSTHTASFLERLLCGNKLLRGFFSDPDKS